jgi:proteasome lid subunit RPN8/RPN11
MTAPDHDDSVLAFRTRGRSKVTLLVQPRPRGNSAYVVYGDGLGAPEVHLHVRILEDLRLATLDAVPHETIGALLGRPCRDDYGTYVVVEHAMTAQAGEHVGTHGGVRISAVTRAAMHRRAAREHPTLEPVGWWHSHPRGLPRYSTVDRDEQATYPRPYHVGVVVAADLFDGQGASGVGAQDPLGVYVGPAATLLTRQARSHGDNPEPVERRAVGAVVVAQPAPMEVSPPPEPHFAMRPAAPADSSPPAAPSRQREIPIRPMIAVGVAAVAVCLAALVWMLLDGSSSGAAKKTPGTLVPETATATCRVGGAPALQLGRPWSGPVATRDASVATGQTNGSRLIVSCNGLGRTVLTVGLPIGGHRVNVHVLGPQRAPEHRR